MSDFVAAKGPLWFTLQQMYHVAEPAPSYYFIKSLPPTVDGFTRHDTILECKVSNSMAVVGWYKGTAKLAVSHRIIG